MSCIDFTAWMPHALLAALTFGVAIGSFIRLGIDRAELAAYHRVGRLPPEEMLRLLKAARIEAEQAAQRMRMR